MLNLQQDSFFAVNLLVGLTINEEFKSNSFTILCTFEDDGNTLSIINRRLLKLNAMIAENLKNISTQIKVINTTHLRHENLILYFNL